MIVPVPVRLVSALALAVWALVGCGAADGTDPTPHPDVTGADAEIALVDDAAADLVLIVSNQSFDDEEVRLTVTVDDATVVDDEFHVEDQHTWIRFPLSVPAGVHEVTTTSDSGAELRQSFELPRDKTRYAVIEHWTEGGSADLTWRFLRQSPVFA